MGVLIADSPNLGIPRLELIEKIESPTTPIDEKATTVILSGRVGELDQKQLCPLCLKRLEAAGGVITELHILTGPTRRGGAASVRGSRRCRFAEPFRSGQRGSKQKELAQPS